MKDCKKLNDFERIYNLLWANTMNK
jgi:hypothetical protein